MFLYPHAVDHLVKVLQKIQKDSKVIQRKEAAMRRRLDPFRPVSKKGSRAKRTVR